MDNRQYNGSNSQEQAVLCQSGMLRHKWKRVAGRARDGSLRCKSCKQEKDGDFLRNEGMSTTRCACGGVLEPPITWHRECVRCGATA